MSTPFEVTWGTFERISFGTLITQGTTRQWPTRQYFNISNNNCKQRGQSIISGHWTSSWAALMGFFEYFLRGAGSIRIRTCGHGHKYSYSYSVSEFCGRSKKLSLKLFSNCFACGCCCFILFYSCSCNFAAAPAKKHAHFIINIVIVSRNRDEKPSSGLDIDTWLGRGIMPGTFIWPKHVLVWAFEEQFLGLNYWF